jgi:hypothetical protein
VLADLPDPDNVIHWEFPNDMPWHLCVFVGRDNFKGAGLCLDASLAECRG